MPCQISAQLIQAFQALIHAALTPFAAPTAAHVVTVAADMRFVHVCGSDAESVGTQTDRLVSVQMSEQLTQRFAAATEPACNANLVSIEELQPHVLAMSGRSELTRLFEGTHQVSPAKLW